MAVMRLGNVIGVALGLLGRTVTNYAWMLFDFKT